MFFANRQIEQMDRAALEKLQTKRLLKTIDWAFSRSPFYREKFQTAGISPQDVASIADIPRLPFTCTKELQQASMHDFLTVPLSSVARVSLWEHPWPIIKAYTTQDIGHNVELMTRSLVAADITRASVVGILGDLADSGLADIQYALELVGAAVVPLSTDYDRAMKLLDASGADTIIGSSRRLLQLVVQLQAANRDILEFPLSKILCLNDMIQNPLKSHIEKRTATEVYNLFASSALGCAGMLFQCCERSGQHFQEDCFYPEIIEFGGNQVIEGASQVGELVVTSLIAEAMPLFRFRTGQTVMRLEEPCACGRTLMRLMTPFGQYS